MGVAVAPHLGPKGPEEVGAYCGRVSDASLVMAATTPS